MVGRAALAVVALYGAFMWAGPTIQAKTAHAPWAHEAAPSIGARKTRGAPSTT